MDKGSGISNNSGTGLSIRCINDPVEFSQMEQDWNELVERVPDASIFQTHQWHDCWWRAFGAPHTLMVMACYDGSRLIALAPMMIIAKVEIRFVGCMNHASDYLDFIIDPDYPDAFDLLIAQLFIQLPGWRRIYLTHLPGLAANLPGLLDFLSQNRLRFTSTLDQRAPFRRLGDAQEDQRILNKQSLRRSYNWFNKAGKLEFRKIHDAAVTLDYLDEFFRQHVTRRAMTIWPSQFHQDEQRQFYRTLVDKLSPTGWLRFDAVLFDEKPIAFHFGFEHRNRFLWYKPTFDTDWANRSPGNVLIRYLLQDSMDRGLKEFDFTVGEEQFKQRFSNCERRNWRVNVFRSAWQQRRHAAIGKLRHWQWRLKQLTDRHGIR